MKFFKYLALPAIVLALFASCDDLFDDAPNDKLSEEVIWSDPLVVDEYVRGFYRGMDSGFSTLVTTIMKGLGTEYEPWFGDQLTVGKRDWYSADYGDLLASVQAQITIRSRQKWSNWYLQIRAINLLLENQAELPASIKDRVLGEAHFFRAYYYYKLLINFGGPLLITRTFDPLTDPVKFPRASYEETVKFITDEAEQAYNLLEKTNTSDNAGRPTQGTALMLKAKTYFWVAGEHFQNAPKPYLGFSDDRSMDMLDKAAAEYDRIIALGVYDLMPISGTSKEDVVKGYRNIFLTKNSIESIWEVQHADDGNFDTLNGHKLDRDAAAPSFGGTTAAYNPTQNHVDEYRMDNGKPIDDPGSGYDRNNPYVGRDYRFYANVLYDGAMWHGHSMDLHYTVVNGKEVAGEDLTPYGESTTAAVSRTGYYMAKFLNENQTIDTDNTYASSQNCILWRYAELLLDYAEIDFKKGRTGDALDKINRIRRRVKMPELTSVTWDDIMNERRVELAFEKTTYWDLLRLNIACEKMTGTTNPLFGVKIVHRADGSVRITNPVVNGRNSIVRYFRDMQYYLPIAWEDVRYHGVDQNPEWIEM